MKGCLLGAGEHQKDCTTGKISTEWEAWQVQIEVKIFKTVGAYMYADTQDQKRAALDTDSRVSLVMTDSKVYSKPCFEKIDVSSCELINE